MRTLSTPLVCLVVVACSLDTGSMGAGEGGHTSSAPEGNGGAVAAPRGGSSTSGARTGGAVSVGGAPTGGSYMAVLGGFGAMPATGGTSAYFTGGVTSFLTGGINSYSTGGVRTGGTSALATGGLRGTGGSSGQKTTCSCTCFCDACNGATTKTCLAGDTSCATCRGPCIDYCTANPSCGLEVSASGTCLVSP
jgi:hypothetical protein